MFVQLNCQSGQEPLSFQIQNVFLGDRARTNNSYQIILHVTTFFYALFVFLYD